MTDKEKTEKIIGMFRAYDQNTAKVEEGRKVLNIIYQIKELDEEQEEGANNE